MSRDNFAAMQYKIISTKIIKTELKLHNNYKLYTEQNNILIDNQVSCIFTFTCIISSGQVNCKFRNSHNQ